MNNLVKNGKIDYNEVLKQFSWLENKGVNCIISPDCDGLLCGLLMQSMFDWNIKGFYDGKIMLIENNISVKNCVFLDMEIFRDYIKSVGQHITLWNKNKKPSNWDNFKNCLSPNIIRNYDGKSNFQKKYPLGTIHLLLGIIGSKYKINLLQEAICPLFYTDGTFKNLFNYPENCLDWFEFLNVSSVIPLKEIFYNDLKTTDLMLKLKDFFNDLKNIGGKDYKGDKIIISNKNGEPKNIIENNNLFSIHPNQVEVTNKFLTLLSKLTGWSYNDKRWNFENMNLTIFNKGSTKPSQKNYDELMIKNPLSLAMISTLDIEYTLEK